VQWVFFGDGDWPASRKGSRSSPGPKKMMGWAQQRYKRWDAECGEWKTRVVPVDEHYTTRCCRKCRAPQQNGRAKKTRRSRAPPEPPPPGSREWQWRRHEADKRRVDTWQQRDCKWHLRSHVVRGLKNCGSSSCGSAPIHSRDGGATWWIGCAGRAMVEGRSRPAHLQRPPAPQRPRLVPVCVLRAAHLPG
jgi:hypothetical protein